MTDQDGGTHEPCAAWLGIDWASDHHDVALQVADSATIEEFRVAHTPAALADWLATLRARFGGRPLGIALETSRGPLVAALLEVPFVRLYPVNPRSLRRFREVFSPNGAKDDAPDARLLLTLVVQHRAQLRCWRPDAPDTRLLAQLVEERRAAIELRTQLVQQLGATLQEYFPQALEWAGDDLAAPMALDFLRHWPTLAAVQRARPTTVRQFYTRHRCRRAERIAARLAAMRTAAPLTRDAALITSRVYRVERLVAQLRVLAPSIRRLEAAIATRFTAHPDAALFANLPGAGAVLAPRLLVAFGTDRGRFPSAAAVQTHVGIAPITVRSGRSTQVHWRWATSTFVRQTFHEFAHHSIGFAPWAKAFYAQQRQRGHSHQAAVRALAFKWIRVLWRCWYDRVPYDEARYESALTRRHSPLSKLLPAAA
jgi:transposase